MLGEDAGALLDDGVTRRTSSNVGAAVDIAAPGTGIVYPAVSGTGYTSGSGTSYAAPYVSALAALLEEAGWTGAGDKTYIINHGAVDIGPAGEDSSFGWGRVDYFNSAT